MPHTTASTAIPTTDTVNAVAPPQSKSFTSWKILIVATVVPGVCFQTFSFIVA
jgi:hypothetical protein